MLSRWFVLLSCIVLVSTSARPCLAELKAGVAKVDITNHDAGPVNDPLYAKALVLTDDQTTVVLITVDAVATEEIGSIKKEFLPNIRAALKQDLRLAPESVLINASHCHGIVCADVEQRTIDAVKSAWKQLVPVRVGVGIGHEDRIMENRRLKLKSGREADVRHAYSLPADEEVVGVGPIDPEIGVLRIDKTDGQPLAVVYNFACHPIQGVPGNANTADLTGFSSRVIEDTLGGGAIALFVQGCAGDINPAGYKEVDFPRSGEPLGNQLAISTLKAWRGIVPTETTVIKLAHQTLELPRSDLTERIAQHVAEVERLVKTLKGTSLNLKTFLPLIVKYNLSNEFPATYSHRYLQQQITGHEDLKKLDVDNRRNLEQYIANIHTMEELTRVQTNLALLVKHQAQHVAAGKRTLDVEVVGVRVGDFVLVTFPGELTVQIGLNIKKQAPCESTFVAGYTNGYIYYAPTTEQLLNPGGAQEDCDSLLAPEWQPIFEKKVAEILSKL